MIDIHPPRQAAHSWTDFFIHIGTIAVGLLLAIGLEQTVELIHHNHQRHQLEQDLHQEAQQNLQVIDRDLKMEDTEPWFRQAMSLPLPDTQHAVHLVLPEPPCIPGSVGTANARYFAPSQAAWTAAQESALIALLPVEQARMHARLAHNYELLSLARDKVANGCDGITAMRRRFAQPDAAHGTETWIMTPAQAEQLAATASQTLTDIQGLLFRLRWSRLYEQLISEDKSAVDTEMMRMNQEQFEDLKPAR